MMGMMGFGLAGAFALPLRGSAGASASTADSRLKGVAPRRQHRKSGEFEDSQTQPCGITAEDSARAAGNVLGLASFHVLASLSEAFF